MDRAPNALADSEIDARKNCDLVTKPPIPKVERRTVPRIYDPQWAWTAEAADTSVIG